MAVITYSYVFLQSTGLKPCKYFSKYFYPGETFSFVEFAYGPPVCKSVICSLLLSAQIVLASPAASTLLRPPCFQCVTEMKERGKRQEADLVSLNLGRLTCVETNCWKTWKQRFAFRINTGQMEKAFLWNSFPYFLSKPCQCSLRVSLFFLSVCYSYCCTL